MPATIEVVVEATFQASELRNFHQRRSRQDAADKGYMAWFPGMLSVFLYWIMFVLAPHA